MSRTKIAIFVATDVVGGHEFQAAELCNSLSEFSDVTVFVNRLHHVSIFKSKVDNVQVLEGLLLQKGNLLLQVLSGFRNREALRKIAANFNYVIVSAGAVEAGVSTGIALSGYANISMYLPFFYDRVPVWGWIGHFYNCMLARSCRLFRHIITINRIQAHVIRAFSGVSTFVIPNKIREVRLPIEHGTSRLVFVGRLDHQKRIDELLRWLDTDVNPILELVIIGDGPLRPQLEQQAQRLSYLKCSFVGWKSPEEQDRLIRSSDILVLNSLLEGEPLVIREARARGMPVAAREIVGTRGVTARSERYATRLELIDCISRAINYLISIKNPIGKPETDQIIINRNKAIAKLVKIVASEV